MVRDWASYSLAQNLDTLQRLSHLARSIFENEMSSENTETSRGDHAMENTPLVLFTGALYHQCQIALHSMVVPLFSGTHHGPTIDPEIVKQSAETVTQHAELCEALLAPYMYGQGDVTLLPPFAGYAAFITGVVFLAIEVSFRDKTSRRPTPGTLSESRRLSTVKGALRLLSKLRFYWRALQLSVSTYSIIVKSGSILTTRNAVGKAGRCVAATSVMLQSTTRINRPTPRQSPRT